jgi:hypothetical protein
MSADDEGRRARLTVALASRDLAVVAGALDDLAELADAVRKERSRTSDAADVRSIVTAFLAAHPDHRLLPTAIWVLGMLAAPDAEPVLAALAARFVDEPGRGEECHQLFIALDNLDVYIDADDRASADRDERARHWLRGYLRVAGAPRR